MRNALAAVVDRLLVRLLLAGARHRWPLLRLVPSSWLRPLVAPPARRLRRPLGRSALWLSLALAAAGAVAALAR